MKMNKLYSKLNSIESTYYNSFFGIDGPLELWINDYIIKYNTQEHVIFKFLETYTKLINQKKSINYQLMQIFAYYNKQTKPTNMIYEYHLIPRNQIKYKIGEYVIGEVIVVAKESKAEYVVNETRVLK